MKKQTKSTFLVFLFVGVVLGVGATGAAEQAVGEGPPTIGVVHITFQPVFTYNGVEVATYGAAHREQWRRLARDAGFRLIQMEAGVAIDGLKYTVDRLIDLGADGIVLFQRDPYATVAAVAQAQQAGIPVVINGIRPVSEVSAPYVWYAAHDTSRLLGEQVAELFRSNNPDGDAVLAVANNDSLEQDANRERGFLEGFRSVIPDVEVAEVTNDRGTAQSTRQTLAAAFLANPDINVVFATTDQRAVGASVVMQGEGIYRNGAAILAGVGGTDRAFEALLSDTAWQAETALNISGVTRETWRVLEQMIDGEIPLESEEEFLVDSTVMVNPTRDEIRDYLSENPGMSDFQPGVE